MSDTQGFMPVLTNGRGVGMNIRAKILVSQQGFGVRYDLDQETGIISNRDHDLYGTSVAQHILVFTQPKGGVAASWSLAGLKERGIAPAGMIFRKASPIFVQGAIFAGIPLIDGLSDDPCRVLHTGEEVILMPKDGCVKAQRPSRV